MLNPRGVNTLFPGLVGGLAFFALYGSMASSGTDPLGWVIGKEDSKH